MAMRGALRRTVSTSRSRSLYTALPSSASHKRQPSFRPRTLQSPVRLGPTRCMHSAATRSSMDAHLDARYEQAGVDDNRSMWSVSESDPEMASVPVELHDVLLSDKRITDAMIPDKFPFMHVDEHRHNIHDHNWRALSTQKKRHFLIKMREDYQRDKQIKEFLDTIDTSDLGPPLDAEERRPEYSETETFFRSCVGFHQTASELLRVDREKARRLGQEQPKELTGDLGSELEAGMAEENPAEYSDHGYWERRRFEAMQETIDEDQTDEINPVYARVLMRRQLHRLSQHVKLELKKIEDFEDAVAVDLPVPTIPSSHDPEMDARHREYLARVRKDIARNPNMPQHKKVEALKIIEKTLTQNRIYMNHLKRLEDAEKERAELKKRGLLQPKKTAYMYKKRR